MLVLLKSHHFVTELFVIKYNILKNWDHINSSNKAPKLLKSVGFGGLKNLRIILILYYRKLIGVHADYFSLFIRALKIPI